MRQLAISIILTALAILLFADPAIAGDRRSGASAWGANYFPNVELTSHTGEKVRFYDDLVAGKIVVINFIYTTCPDACPLETARLAEVQQILGDRVGRDIHMYSITIDPERDTTEVLAEYRERYGAVDGWTFFTGDENDIVLLRKKLGLYIDDLDQEAGDHNLNLVIGNQATGRWQKSSPFENPYVLATQIGQWLTNFSVAKESRNEYEDAPELRSIGEGEKLFRTRCQVCHAIGFSSEDAQKPRVGPNLLGVTDRREHDWLVRWIREPDIMLKEKDPVALGLFYAYNRVPMPNMRLSEKEANQLLDFLEIESKRVAKHEELLSVLPPPPAEGELPGCCEKDELGVISSSRDASTDGISLAAVVPDAMADYGSDGIESGCDEDVTSASKGGLPRSAWSGLGVLLGGLAFALRRRAF